VPEEQDAAADDDPDSMAAPATPGAESVAVALGEDAEVQATDASEAAADPVEQVLAEAARLSAGNARIKALHLLRKAGAKHPTDGRILKAWSAAAEELKAWGEARRVAQRWAQAEGTNEARIAHARLERATGNRTRALSILRDLAVESPQSNEVRELIALYGGTSRLALAR
jgi:hypothetical protein